MATRTVVVNEVLYFLTNNLNLLDNNNFFCNTLEFFNCEDINIALKVLKLEFETLNCDNLEKLVSHGSIKKDKFTDCVSILKHLNSVNLLEKCSIFASVKMSKIPNYENFMKINFENLKKELKDTLYTQQVNLLQTIDVHSKEISALKNHLNCLASNRDKFVSNIPTTESICIQNNPTNLWSDIVKTPTEDNLLPFSVVVRNKKRPRLNNSIDFKSDNNINDSNIKSDTQKKPARIIGSKINGNSILQADKSLIKKSVFAMSNVKKCNKNNVIDYLTEVGIPVISCFPVLKRTAASTGSTPHNENEESTMFRVCINSSDAPKMNDPDNMPEHVIIREWRFINNKPGETTSSNNG